MSITREIPLTRGYVAVVDEADYEWLSQWKWLAQVASSGIVYASRRRLASDGKGPGAIYMHREIFGGGVPLVDHADGDGLNNRRSNLRAATKSQNRANGRLMSTNSTGFRGVSLARRQGMYLAQIESGGKSKHLGYFSCPLDAALAYDEAARRIFGEFARPNFPAPEVSP
jgi:hypothetical protein